MKRIGFPKPDFGLQQISQDMRHIPEQDFEDSKFFQNRGRGMSKKKGKGFFDDFAKGFQKGFTGVINNPITGKIVDKLIDTHLGGGIHHHHIPVHLTHRQMRTLAKGGAITLNPSSIMETAEHFLKLLPQQGKKVLNAIKNNKGVRVALKAGEDLINKITGKGFFDDIGRVFSPVVDRVAPVLIDKAIGHLTGGKAKKRHPKKGKGFFDDIGRAFSPIVDKVAPVLVDKAIGHLMGGAIHGIRGPVGNLDMPIQLGSPYQHIGSPAMHPFIPTHGIQSYSPITHTMGSGIMPSGGINPPGSYGGTGIMPAGARYGRGKATGHHKVGKGWQEDVGAMLGPIASIGLL